MQQQTLPQSFNGNTMRPRQTALQRGVVHGAHTAAGEEGDPYHLLSTPCPFLLESGLGPCTYKHPLVTESTGNPRVT